MFTYYLLKKLQETSGNTSLGELTDYVKAEVSKQAFKEKTRHKLHLYIIRQNWKNGETSHLNKINR